MKGWTGDIFFPSVKIFGRNVFIWFHLTLSLHFCVNFIDESATYCLSNRQTDTDLSGESAVRAKGWDDEFTFNVCIDPLPPPPFHLPSTPHSNGFSSISIWTAALTNTFQPHGRNGSDSFKLRSICAFFSLFFCFCVFFLPDARWPLNIYPLKLISF